MITMSQSSSSLSTSSSSLVRFLILLASNVLLGVTSKQAQYSGGYDLYLRPVTNTLLVLNSAVNFVVYVLQNTTHPARQKLLIELFCGRRHNTF